MSLLDMDEKLLDIAARADILHSPIVDGKEIPPVDLALVEGAVTSEEHRLCLEHIRKQARVLVSLGDCAVHTNITGMRNRIPLPELLQVSYAGAISNDGTGEEPQDAQLMSLSPQVSPLHAWVKVDYFLPGCPPDAHRIYALLDALLDDREPPDSLVKNLTYG